MQPNQGGIRVQAYSQRLSKLFAGGTLPEKTVDEHSLHLTEQASSANLEVHTAMKSGRMPEFGRRLEMTHSNLKVEVQGTHILVVLRGTCFRAKYRKQNAPWLATEEYGPDDPDAPMSLSEFRSLAYAAASEAAHQLGWIKSSEELHRAAKRAGN